MTIALYLGAALGIFGAGFGLGGLHANRRWRSYIDSKRVHGARTLGQLREMCLNYDAAGLRENDVLYLGLSEEEARARYGRRS